MFGHRVQKGFNDRARSVRSMIPSAPLAVVPANGGIGMPRRNARRSPVRSS
jgi:hypothetical protein